VLGRKSVVWVRSKLNKTKIRKMYLDGVKVKDIAKLFGVSRQTVYRVVKDLVPHRYNRDTEREYRRALFVGFLLSLMLAVVAYVSISWFMAMKTLPPEKASFVFFTVLLAACLLWACIVLVERARKIFKGFLLK